MTTDYARALGSRLRAIRTQQGLSLHGVEEKSAGTLEGRRGRLLRAWRPRRHRPAAGRARRLLRRAGGASCCPTSGPCGRRPSRRRAWSSTWSASAGARREGRTARALLRDDPEPARRLQRPGAVGAPGRPAHPGRDLRPVTQRARRAVHQLGRPEPRAPPRPPRCDELRATDDQRVLHALGRTATVAAVAERRVRGRASGSAGDLARRRRRCGGRASRWSSPGCPGG